MAEPKPKRWSQRKRERAENPKRPGEPKRIEGLYAFLAVEGGCESIVASFTPVGVTPLVGSKKSDMSMLATLARRVANGTQIPVRCIRFDRGREVMVLQPEPRDPADLAEKIGPDLYAPKGVNPEMLRAAKAMARIGESVGATRAPEDDPPGQVGVGRHHDMVAINTDVNAEDGDMILLDPDKARAFAEAMMTIARAIDGKEAMVVYAGVPKGPGVDR